MIHVSRINNAISRAYEKVIELRDDNSNLHSSSKDQLMDCYKQCKEMVDILSAKLNIPPVIELQGVASVASLEELSKRIDELYQIVNSDNQRNNINIDISSDEVDSNKNVQLHNKTYISVKQKKSVIHNYAKTFSSMVSSSEINNCNRYVVKCCQILNDWFQTRFVKHNKDQKFHYNILNIHRWVESIVLSFSWYIDHKNMNEFDNEFRSWVLGTESGELHVPLTSHASKIYSNPDKYDASYSLIIIWESLFNLGLNELEQLNDENFSPYSYFTFFDYWYQKYNPEMLDEIDDMMKFKDYQHYISSKANMILGD